MELRAESGLRIGAESRSKSRAESRARSGAKRGSRIRLSPRCLLHPSPASRIGAPPALLPVLKPLCFVFPRSKIVLKIDGDKDGFVTVEELKEWIKFAQKRWIYEDVERQWKGHDLNGDGAVSWDEYRNATYGSVLGEGPVTL